VDSRRPHRLPFQGDIQRVVGKYRFLVIISLVKANTLPISQVYGRDNFYFIASPSRIMRKLYTMITHETMNRLNVCPTCFKNNVI
jgi:hypothetical protein